MSHHKRTEETMELLKECCPEHDESSFAPGGFLAILLELLVQFLTGCLNKRRAPEILDDAKLARDGDKTPGGRIARLRLAWAMRHPDFSSRDRRHAADVALKVSEKASPELVQGLVDENDFIPWTF